MRRTDDYANNYTYNYLIRAGLDAAMKNTKQWLVHNRGPTNLRNQQGIPAKVTFKLRPKNIGRS